MYSEVNEDNKKSQNGYYKHKETGAVVHLEDDPKYGVPLTNAYKRAGFEFVGTEAPKEESQKEKESKK